MGVGVEDRKDSEGACDKERDREIKSASGFQMEEKGFAGHAIDGADHFCGLANHGIGEIAVELSDSLELVIEHRSGKCEVK
jgi:hypothetical protein